MSLKPRSMKDLMNYKTNYVKGWALPNEQNIIKLQSNQSITFNKLKVVEAIVQGNSNRVDKLQDELQAKDGQITGLQDEIEDIRNRACSKPLSSIVPHNPNPNMKAGNSQSN